MRWRQSLGYDVILAHMAFPKVRALTPGRHSRVDCSWPLSFIDAEESLSLPGWLIGYAATALTCKYLGTDSLRSELVDAAYCDV